MTLQLVLIEEVEIRVQWSGNWIPFYPGDGVNTPSGFPGIKPPKALVKLASMLSDKTFVIDATSDHLNQFRVNIRGLFQAASRTLGSALNNDWTLIGTGYRTTSGQTVWKGTDDANGLAFPVGKGEDDGPYIELYPFVDYQKVGMAMFWLNFVILEIP